MGSSDDTSTLPEGEEVAPPPEIGQTIGRFLVLGILGAGGMGVVVSAHDPGLNRRVAIKLLRGDRWSGERAAAGRETLLREAQAMARFSHPNVVAVYEISSTEASTFVVMEQIEGRTLRAWLHEQRRGWREIVDMLLQAGRGLAAAHSAGVVHRDVKPENVLVGTDGRPRVTDFGLALAAPPGAGTKAYMAPEQAAGKPVDARADQYAFCVTAWEALCGERPTGKARRLGWLRRPLARGLAERPEDRWPSMDALLAALRAAAGRPRTIGRVAAATLGVAAVAAVWAASRAPARPKRMSELRQLQLTFDGRAQSFGLSPDGKTLAYWSKSSVRLVDVDGHRQWEICADAPAGSEFRRTGTWLPDSSAVEWTYQAGKDYFGLRTPRDGGPSVRVAAPFWSAYRGDGKELASARSYAKEIELRSADGSVRRFPIEGSYDSLLVIDWARNADWFLFGTVSGHRQTVWTMHRDGRRNRILELEQGGPNLLRKVRLAPAGRGVLYLRRRTSRESDLWYLPLRDGEPAGEARVAIEGIEADDISLSRDGKRLAYTRSREPAHVWLVSIEGPESPRPDVRARRLLGDAAPKGSVRVSPDGKQIAYAAVEGRWHSLFVIGTGGGLPRRVLATEGDLLSPAWSSDSGELAFLLTGPEGKSSLWIASADDGRARQLSTRPGMSEPISWAPQSAISISTSDYFDFILVDPWTGADRRLFPDGHELAFSTWGLSWSPDSAWAAIPMHRRNGSGLWLVSADGRTERRLGEDADPVGWSADGQWIYVLSTESKEVQRLPFAGGDAQPWLTLPIDEDIAHCSMTTDSRQMACLAGTIGNPWLGESDIWMIDDFDQLMPH